MDGKGEEQEREDWKERSVREEELEGGIERKGQGSRRRECKR